MGYSRQDTPLESSARMAMPTEAWWQLCACRLCSTQRSVYTDNPKDPALAWSCLPLLGPLL